MYYYYYDVVLVEDSITVTLQNVGSATPATAPENAELFSVRPSSEDIDLSSVESLDAFEPSCDVTDYVLLDMKIVYKSCCKSLPSSSRAFKPFKQIW